MSNNISDLIGSIITSENYQIVIDKINKEKKRLEKLEDVALSLGFTSDNYYTPREKMNMENELNRDFSDSREPMSRLSAIH